MDPEQELEDFADGDEVEQGEARKPARRGKARLNAKRRRYGELDEEDIEDEDGEEWAGSLGQWASRCMRLCPPGRPFGVPNSPRERPSA